MTTSSKPYNSKSSSPLLPLGPRVRSALSPRVSVGLDASASEKNPDMAKQSFKDECDINVIMRRYEKTGTIDWLTRQDARYMDVTGHDFREAMNMMALGKTAFEELPARIRERFDNDPAKFLDFMHNDDNRKEAAELGLLSPEATAAALSDTSPAPQPEPVPAAPKAAS